jgi:hypothetical protein
VRLLQAPSESREEDGGKNAGIRRPIFRGKNRKNAALATGVAKAVRLWITGNPISHQPSLFELWPAGEIGYRRSENPAALPGGGRCSVSAVRVFGGDSAPPSKF